MSRQRDNRKNYPRLLLVLGIIALLFGTANLALKAHYLATHDSTRGKVVDFVTHVGGSSDYGGSVTQSNVAVIEYDLPDGEKATFNSVRAGSGNDAPVGLASETELTVYYNPENPYDARAGDFVSFWGWGAGFLTFGLFCLGLRWFLIR